MKITSRLSPSTLVYPAAIFALIVPILLFSSKHGHIFSAPLTVRSDAPRLTLSFGKHIKSLHINVGPNLGSIVPPQEDPSVGVLALEANLGIANYLREKHQKNGYPHRFFVVNCAVAGPPLAGGLASFHYYNAAGGSSSLSEARDEAVGRQAWTNRTAFDPSDTYGPGPAAVDFVPVLSLETVLAAVPTNVSIDFLKTDTQGYDLAVIRSASRLQLRRVRMLTTETYLKGAGNAKYKNVKNDLVDWIPYMRTMGFRLTNPPQPHQSNEYDAIWMRED